MYTCKADNHTHMSSSKSRYAQGMLLLPRHSYYARTVLCARYSLLYALNYARQIGAALLPEIYSSSLIIHEYISALIILVQWARNCLQDFDNSELQVDCEHKLIVSTPRFEQKCEINRPLKVLSAKKYKAYMV